MVLELNLESSAAFETSSIGQGHPFPGRLPTTNPEFPHPGGCIVDAFRAPSVGVGALDTPSLNVWFWSASNRVSGRLGGDR